MRISPYFKPFIGLLAIPYTCVLDKFNRYAILSA